MIDSYFIYYLPPFGFILRPNFPYELVKRYEKELRVYSNVPLAFGLGHPVYFVGGEHIPYTQKSAAEMIVVRRTELES